MNEITEIDAQLFCRLFIKEEYEVFWFVLAGFIIYESLFFTTFSHALSLQTVPVSKELTYIL